MSDYPVWWDQTITIYNKYEDPTTQIITWYRRTISDCFWKYERDIAKINDVTLETNYTICRIPKNDAFIEKYEWVTQPNDEMADYFTLGIGDIIIRGEVEDEIDEYVKGHRSSDIIAKYKDLQGCIQIEAVSINVGAGRCNEHYYVQG